ncbi:MAG: ISAs1 family transposase, partial [Acidobacteriota bacterium]
ENLDWLRSYLRLQHGIPSHDTFGRVFGLIDPGQFEQAFRRWMRGVLPALSDEVVAIYGKTGAPGDRSSSLGWKTSRRSGGIDSTALHLVSAFAAGAGLVLGQRGTAEKSNEKTAIPELLSTLALEGCTVTIDAMGTHEQRLYISSLTPDAARTAATVRAHWSVENRLHWCMDIAFNDDQMRARTGHAAHNLASLKQLTLNPIRMDPVKRKGGIKARRIIAAASDNYRAHLLGLG